MYIKSFEYKNLTWDLDTIYLNRLNLIVGKNAVGKSKTLKALVDVAKFINGETLSSTLPSLAGVLLMLPPLHGCSPS